MLAEAVAAAQAATRQQVWSASDRPSGAHLGGGLGIQAHEGAPCRPSAAAAAPDTCRCRPGTIIDRSSVQALPLGATLTWKGPTSTPSSSLILYSSGASFSDTYSGSSTSTEISSLTVCDEGRRGARQPQRVGLKQAGFVAEPALLAPRPTLALLS